METTEMPTRSLALLPLCFLIAATACLTVGGSMGMWMGMSHDFGLAPVHAHLNLLGWTSLALIGLTFRGWPELGHNRALALAQFGLSTASAMLFPVGIYLAIRHGQPALSIVAAVVWMLGVLLFLGRLVALAVGFAPARAAILQPAE